MKYFSGTLLKNSVSVGTHEFPCRRIIFLNPDILIDHKYHGRQGVKNLPQHVFFFHGYEDTFKEKGK
jgi:hypothetical protein